MENALVKVFHRVNELRKAQLLQAPPSGHAWTSYYFAGSARVAMRVQVSGSADQVYYLLTDHLGSTTVSYRSDGRETSFQQYYPWGALRGGGNSLPTDRTYSGQRLEEVGLYFFNARWFDAALGRFAQADTVIPEQSQGVQAWDRFAFVNNNPVKYIDSSGHDVGCGGMDASLSGMNSIPELEVAVDESFSEIDASLAQTTVTAYAEFLGGNSAFLYNVDLAYIGQGQRISHNSYNATYDPSSDAITLQMGWYADSIFRSSDGYTVIQTAPTDYAALLGFPEGTFSSEENGSQFVLAHELTHGLSLGNPELLSSFQGSVDLNDFTNPIIKRNKGRGNEEIFADVIAAYQYAPTLLNDDMKTWVEKTMPGVLK